MKQKTASQIYVERQVCQDLQTFALGSALFKLRERAPGCT